MEGHPSRELVAYVATVVVAVLLAMGGTALVTSSGCVTGRHGPQDAASVVSEIDASPCAGGCDVDELCVEDEADGGPRCSRICANGLHCWSGCCLPASDADGAYSVCRAEWVCFGK